MFWQQFFCRKSVLCKGEENLQDEPETKILQCLFSNRLCGKSLRNGLSLFFSLSLSLSFSCTTLLPLSLSLYPFSSQSVFPSISVGLMGKFHSTFLSLFFLSVFLPLCLSVFLTLPLSSVAEGSKVECGCLVSPQEKNFSKKEEKNFIIKQ